MGMAILQPDLQSFGSHGTIAFVNSKSRECDKSTKYSFVF